MGGDSWMIDALLYVVYLLLGVVTGLAVWSGLHGVRSHLKTKEPTRGVPARAIAYGVAGLLAVVMLITFLLGSSNPMLINSQWFKDVMWLKLTDMFIYTALILLIVAAIGVAIGGSGLIRKVKR